MAVGWDTGRRRIWITAGRGRSSWDEGPCRATDRYGILAPVTAVNTRAREAMELQLPAALVRASGLLVLAALVLGTVVRAVPVLSADFPLNDGGLFAVMSDDLRANGFALPAFTSYNGGDIPFGYPPLGLYLNALLSPVLGGNEASLRFLPLLITCLTIPAFWFMVRGWVSPATAAVATFAWAIIPRSWMWQVGGGGITRSLGMLFAFVAIGAAIRLLATNERRWWIIAPVAAGLTALSHLESAAFVGATLLVAWLFHHRSRRSLGMLLGVAALAALIASPWLISVVAQHGLTPLTAAGGSRAAFMNIALAILVSLRWTAEPFVEVGAMVGIIGLGIAIATGRWWLPVWIVAIFLALPGGAATYAMVPWALLIALAVSRLVALATARRALDDRRRPRGDRAGRERLGALRLPQPADAGVRAAARRHDLGTRQHARGCLVPRRDRLLLADRRHRRVVPRPQWSPQREHRAGQGVHLTGSVGARRECLRLARRVRDRDRPVPRRLDGAVGRPVRLRLHSPRPHGRRPGRCLLRLACARALDR